MSDVFFSTTYAQARGRFLKAAARLQCEVASFAVSAGSESGLYIDVAIIGPADGNTVLVTSGVHGVEGFFGSAVQLALLESLASGSNNPGVSNNPSGLNNSRVRYVLIHAVNPYGFNYLRRCNEDNVDLNRNFPGTGNRYSGAPQGYQLHHQFLNPQSLPSQSELFKLIAIWKILRYGIQSLKESIASGQYEYPEGLFYGGHEPCESCRLIADNLPDWLNESQRIVHIDLHTGLGKYGKYKLLVNEQPGEDVYDWYSSLFGAKVVEPLSADSATAYPVTGVFGEWAQQHFCDRDYRVIGAEFGTYNVVRVLSALRRENRIHHFGHAGSAKYDAAKQELLECFCPADRVWRAQVVDSATEIIFKVTQALIFTKTYD